MQVPGIYKVTKVSMANPFWLNGMKAEAFCQLHHSHHPGTESAIQNHSTQAKGTFDLLMLNIKQSSFNTSIQFVSDL